MPLLEAALPKGAGEHRLLDLGGNIGVVSCEAALRGFSVVALEPEPGNCKRFLLHAKGNRVQKKVTLIEAAAVGTNARTTTLFVADTANQGIHSLEEVSGRRSITVNARNISALLEKHAPTHVKVDVEGGEYGLLPQVFSCESVHFVFAELHFGTAGLRIKLDAMCFPDAAKWSCIKTPNYQNKYGTTLGFWKRL